MKSQQICTLISAVFMLLLMIAMSACAKPKICDLGLYDYSCDNLNNINSKFTLFENTAMMDTTLAHINAQVLYTDTTTAGLAIEEGGFGASVLIKNQIDSLVFGNISGVDGKTGFFAEPGVYNLQISFIGYNTLTIQGLSLESGMVVDLKAVMGDGCGQNSFRLKDDNRLEEILPSQNSK